MNESKWREALKLSRFTQETSEMHAKVLPILDYVARLEPHSSKELTLGDALVLQDSDLRADSLEESLPLATLKGLSKSFLDGYFMVPKVLGDEGGAE
jgi:Asp-tRNA(Asn)/Glu-tRNA(Gln) amidotransferase C subunit